MAAAGGELVGAAVLVLVLVLVLDAAVLGAAVSAEPQPASSRARTTTGTPRSLSPSVGTALARPLSCGGVPGDDARAARVLVVLTAVPLVIAPARGQADTSRLRCPPIPSPHRVEMPDRSGHKNALGVSVGWEDTRLQRATA